MSVYTSASQLIGKTPLVELTNVEKDLNLSAKLYAKVEYFNPSGSVKDRIALAMIEDAEKSGKLKPGYTIIEPTSGNTGIGLAAIAAAKGYPAIIVMPDTMSVERRAIIQFYGAKIELSEGAKGMKGAIARAQELADEIGTAFIPSQFDNPANPTIHYNTTGPEIYNDLEGKVDVFVSGVGTGGTLTGAGKFLKEKTNVQVVAVEPEGSPVLSEGKSGPHKIQGIGAGFVPNTLDTSTYDSISKVSNEEAFAKAKYLAKKEGIGVGISSGAALAAAILEAQKPENAGKNVVVLLPDSADRYYSTPLFQD